jgi:hypothetical protein
MQPPTDKELTWNTTTTPPLAIPASLLYARSSWTLALMTGTTQPEVLWASSVHTFESTREKVEWIDTSDTV